jgi:hypothetical protein
MIGDIEVTLRGGKTRRPGSELSFARSLMRHTLGVGALALTVLALTSAGCGGGGDRSTATLTGTSGEVGHGREKQDPSQVASSPTINPRAAGHRACRGATPVEVARRYQVIAHRRGPRKRFAELVVHPSPEVESSPGYPRLVAALYATTVPAGQRTQAAEGCVEELAAASHGGKAPSSRMGQEGLPGRGSQEQKGSN